MFKLKHLSMTKAKSVRMQTVFLLLFFTALYMVFGKQIRSFTAWLWNCYWLSLENVDILGVHLFLLHQLIKHA